MGDAQADLKAGRLKPGQLRVGWIVAWLLAVVGASSDSRGLQLAAGLLVVLIGTLGAADVGGVTAREAAQSGGGRFSSLRARRVGGIALAISGLLIVWVALA